VTFEILLFKLRSLLREKVKNGELTERGMARATGVSQPHLHNILKGIRTLPPELADQLISLAGLDLQNLIGMKPFEAEGPALTGIAAASNGNSSEIEGFVPTIAGPVADYPGYQLTADASMEPRFRCGDVVYYQQGARERTLLDARAAYLVSYNGRILVRYLRMGGQRLYLASEESLADPVRWDYVSLTDRHILEIVRGQIVWICRKVEEAETGAPEETR